MNHVIPFRSVIVAILITLFVAGVSVFVPEFVVDELASTEFTTALELESVMITKNITHGVFAVTAVANDQELGQGHFQKLG
jgi:hypothetical protein